MENVELKNIHKDSVDLKPGNGNLKWFVRNMVSELDADEKNVFANSCTFKIRDENKKTQGYLLLKVAKKEEKLYEGGILKVQCLKCGELMEFTCFGRDHREAYHCMNCGTFVYADLIKKHEGKAIKIIQGCISKEQDGAIDSALENLCESMFNLGSQGGSIDDCYTSFYSTKNEFMDKLKEIAGIMVEK